MYKTIPQQSVEYVTRKESMTCISAEFEQGNMITNNIF